MKKTIIESQINELISKDYFIVNIDGSKCETLTLFIKIIAIEFKFPDYYGKNINSFLECINDLDWLLESDYALIINNSDFLLSKDTRDGQIYLRNLLEDISKEWSNVPNYEGEEKFRNKSEFKVIYC